MEQAPLHTALRFFKALADETRLRMLAILADREASVEELAAMLNLRAPTVSHHLARLKEVGLVRMRPEGTAHVYRLDVDALRAMSKGLLAAEKLTSLAEAPDGHAWERKVLRDFFEGERLKEIPASRKKRFVILKWLADQFEPGRRYTEREVNEILKRYHADTATLRRELISDAHRLMQRDGGVYWRVAPPSESKDRIGTGRAD
jgi:predicted transcriptional regulator